MADEFDMDEDLRKKIQAMLIGGASPSEVQAMVNTSSGLPADPNTALPPSSPKPQLPDPKQQKPLPGTTARMVQDPYEILMKGKDPDPGEKKPTTDDERFMSNPGAWVIERGMGMKPTDEQMADKMDNWLPLNGGKPSLPEIAPSQSKDEKFEVPESRIGPPALEEKDADPEPKVDPVHQFVRDTYPDRFREASEREQAAIRKAGRDADMAHAMENMTTTGAGIRAKHLPKFGSATGAAQAQAAGVAKGDMEKLESSDASSGRSTHARQVIEAIMPEDMRAKIKNWDSLSYDDIVRTWPEVKDVLERDYKAKVLGGEINEKEKKWRFDSSNEFGKGKTVSTIRESNSGLDHALSALSAKTPEADNVGVIEAIRSAGVNRINERELNMFLNMPGMVNIFDRASQKLTGKLDDNQRSQLVAVLQQMRANNAQTVQGEARTWAERNGKILKIDPKELENDVLLEGERGEGVAPGGRPTVELLGPDGKVAEFYKDEYDALSPDQKKLYKVANG